MRVELPICAGSPHVTERAKLCAGVTRYEFMKSRAAATLFASLGDAGGI